MLHYLYREASREIIPDLEAIDFEQSNLFELRSNLINKYGYSCGANTVMRVFDDYLMRQDSQS